MKGEVAEGDEEHALVDGHIGGVLLCVDIFASHSYLFLIFFLILFFLRTLGRGEEEEREGEKRRRERRIRLNKEAPFRFTPLGRLTKQKHSSLKQAPIISPDNT